MTDRREILNHLISKKIQPFTAFKLKADFNQSQIRALVDFALSKNKPQEAWENLLSYVSQTYEKFLENIQISILQDVFQGLKESVSSEENYSDTFGEFQQEDPNEIAKFLGDLHIKMQDLEHKKEEMIHFISLFENTKEYFSSLNSSLPVFLKLILPSVSDPSYFKSDAMYSAILQDIESNILWLKNRGKELNLCVEEILNKRINRLYKIESSIRLLQKYRNPTGGRTLGVESV